MTAAGAKLLPLAPDRQAGVAAAIARARREAAAELAGGVPPIHRPALELIRSARRDHFARSLSPVDRP